MGGKILVGLTQMSLKGATSDSPERLRASMLDAHAALIEEAGRNGVQVLGLQELFNLPYFCPSKDLKWFAAAETLPDSPSVRFLSAYAARYSMVIVAPLFEIGGDGRYYNTAAVIDHLGRYIGKYRKVHIRNAEGGIEKFFFTNGNLGYPVFETTYCRLGVYICFDRHFPEGWRALALNGAQLILNPSATSVNISQYLWKLEQPAAAVANGVFIGANNRVGIERPWSFGPFYGSSYIVDPLGRILATGSENRDELVIAEVDLSLIETVRRTWNIFESRQPTTYGGLIGS